VKSYTASPEFAAEYARIRNERKPAAPKVSGSAADDVKKEREEQEQQIEEMRRASPHFRPTNERPPKKASSGPSSR